MYRKAMFRWFRLNAIYPLAILTILLVVILGFTMMAIESATLYSDWYSLLLIANIIGFLLLFALVSYYIWLLYKGVKARLAGARLTAHLVLFFVTLSFIPLVILFLFALNVIVKSIDSWFDSSLDQGFSDALELSRTALDTKLLDALKLTHKSAATLEQIYDEFAVSYIENLRFSTNAKEMTLFGAKDHIIAFSTNDLSQVLPDLPSAVIRLSVRQGVEYVRLEPIADGLQVRVLILLNDHSGRMLQAIYAIPERYTVLAASTENASLKYKQYKNLRQPLKLSFIIVLVMVLLLAILLAFGGAFFAARRIVAPVKELSDATKAIADGHYEQSIPLGAKGELGFLVESFNEMSKRLSMARKAEKEFQQLLEVQSLYLASVLEKLSSGVMVIDLTGKLRMWNQAVIQILKVTDNQLEQREIFNQSLSNQETEGDVLEDFFMAIRGILPAPFHENDEKKEEADEWRKELVRFCDGKRQILSIRCARQKDQIGLKGGYIVVFDDITSLITSEREAAWGEVARRLAHEIKNPLTPIQLAAERMRLKLVDHLEEKDSKLVDKSTQTIISQVSAMKEMVDAFSQYARPPKLNLRKLDLNYLVNDVIYLYKDYPTGIEINLQLSTTPAFLLADEGRLRQLLHNLVKNAAEACYQQGGIISIHTQVEDVQREVKLVITDNGPGFEPEVINNVYEPYVTTKIKGTGLGLSIVKKIVEEHEGVIAIQSQPGEGASIVMRFPHYEG